LLSRIPGDYFRVLTAEEMGRRIELDTLISRYERLTRRIKTLRQWIKNDGRDYGLMDAVRQMRKEKEDAARKIIEKVSNNAIYKEACKRLGVNGDSVELVILIIKLPFHLPLQRLKGLLGFIPGKGKAQYDHKLRKHVASFATSLYMCAKKGVSVSNEVAEITNRLPKKSRQYINWN
jgi:hypothetical protein